MYNQLLVYGILSQVYGRVMKMMIPFLMRAFCQKMWALLYPGNWMLNALVISSKKDISLLSGAGEHWILSTGTDACSYKGTGKIF